MTAIVAISQVNSSGLGAVTQGGSLADAWPSPTHSLFLYTGNMEALNEGAKRAYSSIRRKLVIFLFNFILIAATIRAERSYMEGSVIGLVSPSI